MKQLTEIQCSHCLHIANIDDYIRQDNQTIICPECGREVEIP